MTKPVTIPNTFATATTAIPLSQLDSDFSTVATALNDANTYSNYAADTGVVNAYVVTLTGVSTTYSAGLRIQFKAGNANTGASTLNVNGGGTKNITFQDASALSSGTIAANAIVDVMYDGTQFLLMNDPAGAIGDVVGPASATANAAAIFDSTTGKLIKDSKVIITPVANSSTLTIANNKTVTVNNTLTLSGTDSTTMTFPSTSATIARTDSAQTFTGVQTFSSDASVNGLTVGRGAGAVATNTAVGASALAANTTGGSNTSFGYYTLYKNTTGDFNTAIGGNNSTPALFNNTTGSYNTAVGSAALQANTTSQQNTAVGYQALYNVLPATISVSAGALTNGVEYTITGLGTVNWTSIGAASATVGVKFTYNNATITGSGGSVTQNVNAANTAIGYGSGSAITTGTKNTILGAYSGNQGGLDIRTASNYIVLSDGDGNPLISTNSTRSVALNGAVPQTGTGITFPATQSASSDANTLDDYEEGTWTSSLTVTASTSGTITVTDKGGTYTKIGNIVTVQGYFNVASVSSPVGDLRIGGLPFTISSSYGIGSASLQPYGFGTTSTVTAYYGLQISNQTYFAIRGFNNGAQVSTVANNVQAGTGMQFTVTYQV